MNAALYWKEYRQQRSLWLATGGLAVLLAVVVAETFGRGSGLAVFQDDRVRGILVWIGFALTVAYSLACGAVLLAGEKEEATIVFLDTLPAAREAIWRTKVTAGFLASALQGLLLAIMGLGFLPWELALCVPLVGADALIWGLVAGALCRHVLLAVVTGIALLLVSWVVSLLLSSFVALLVLKAAGAVLGLAWSHRVFCAPERARRLYAQRLGLPGGKEERAPRPWRVLTWLFVRQGRWVLVGTVAASILLGCAVNLAPLVLYPAGTLLLGLVCGLSTFAPEQYDQRRRFLGTQRFPPGQIWVAKLLFWVSASLCFVMLLWAVAVGSLVVRDAHLSRYTGVDDYWQQQWWGGALVERGFFMFLWLIHGFCLGQFCAMWAARPVIAAVLALFLGAAWSCLWLPSILFGGVASWQVLAVPLLLLVATRLYCWHWLTDRLYTIRSLAGLSGLSLAALLLIAAGIGYRVLEIPDVGEPAAVKAFLATIPQLENNEAGPLIRRAGREFFKHLGKVNAELAPPAAGRPPAPAPGALFPPPPPGMPPLAAADDHRPYDLMLNEALDEGWPKDDRKLSRWLDRVCYGQWFQDVQRAARLPLGLVQDPRALAFTGALQDPCHAREMTHLLGGRALQLAATGKAAETLDQVETLLGFSRQLRHLAPAQLVNIGSMAEYLALTAQASWLEKAQPDRAQLRAAVQLLLDHEQQRPEEWQALAAAYLVARNSLDRDPSRVFGAHTGHDHPTNRSVWHVAWLVPWERARQDRLGNLIYDVWLQQAVTPYWEIAAVKEALHRQCGVGVDFWAHHALSNGFPPATGPGSDWRPAYWGKLLMQSWPEELRGYWPGPPRQLTQLRGEMLTTALVLFQVEKGKLPRQLAELVPDYLPSLPVDPFTGQSFAYRISEGETVDLSLFPGDKKALALQPGQALVRSGGKESASRSERPEDRYHFPVPLRAQRKGP